MTASEAAFEEIEPAAADTLVDDGAFLLDVREEDEWHAGHAPAAYHIPLGDLANRLGEVPSDRTVVCVCRGGGRSARAADALANLGYESMNLVGGMRAWAAAGLAIVNLEGDPGAVI